ncbi:HD domain-containing protein [Planctomicrobium piriforme]|uniref:HD domain-containing protein n=1 Tax=Planctomicrobium piriforme TaxID=1576369 RepID=A0A1I3MKP9_9PLAN|nr:HD domain-containing protein [Planctomicrobium piriforme]SFI97597.1 HD domain-containing protein [Planctomicrobium piriforme]
MSDEKIRRRIAVDAAQLLMQRQETDLKKARLRAARRLFKGYIRKDNMPSEAEIRDEIEKLSYVVQGDVRFDNLRQVRVGALNFMRRLAEYEPRIMGDLVSGDVRTSAAAEVFFHEEDEAAVMERLEALLKGERVDQTPVIQDPLSPTTAPVPMELDFMEHPEQHGISLAEFERLVAHAYPDLGIESAVVETPSDRDRFEVYRMLLSPLEQVQQRKSQHPEGDALYHSLQVFELAREELPYDEEFLLAALLHDIGKGIDSGDSLQAGLTALSGYVTDRTVWFIENLHDAQRLLENSVGARARKRLQHHEDIEELLLLARCDRDGRVPGGTAPTLDAAIEYLRDLARSYG